MSIETLVIGLSGTEIRNDLHEQFDKLLDRSCDLRDTDSYGQGYKAKIKIELDLIGVDSVHQDLEITAGPTRELTETADAKLAEVKEAFAADPSLPVPEQVLTPKHVEAEIEVPQEPDLNAVRERSGQGIPTESVDGEGRPTVKRRRYVKAEAAAQEPTGPNGQTFGRAEEF